MSNQLSVITIKSFLEAWERGDAAYEEAARILVQLVEQDPTVLERITTKCPRVRMSTLRKFLLVGKGRLLSTCAFSDNSGVRALSRLDLSEQQKFLAGPIELLIFKAGNPESLMLAVDALTPDQVRQVFAKDHIRSLGEQRAWVECRRSKGPDEPKPDYTVHRDFIMFRGAKLPKRLLIQWLSEMP